ncbi:hypothetical protein PV326_002882 [Microctonus aethiopoides]|nr:hypothetical protein PV326_002882 [Microctonus aethiopoides]
MLLRADTYIRTVGKVDYLDYFPVDMLIPPTADDRASLLSSFGSAFRGCLIRNDLELPRICSYVWVKGPRRFEYIKTRLVLVDRKLYTSESLLKIR